MLLRKGVYPYEYTGDWEKFNETTLPKKEEFCSNLNDFEIKNLGEYYDLYFKTNTLLLPDVFENFRKMFLKIYQLDPAQFISAPGLAWPAASKKTEVELELLTDIDCY